MPSSELGGEAVGELVRVRAGAEPCVGPVGGREREESGGAVVEVGAQLADLSAFPEERTDPLLVPPALGDELLAPLALEVAPFPDEDRGDVELLRNDPQVRTKRGADAVEDGTVLRKRVECGVEGLGALPRHLPEEVGLGVDMGIERAFLEAERLGEVADRRAVVALLREEPGGGAG